MLKTDNTKDLQQTKTQTHTNVCFLWARGRLRMKTVIVVHGGAWAIPDALAEASVAGVKNAVRAGDTVLKNGGSAIDAVEKAVRLLEDNPAFDAGHGAVLNIDGEVELDSIIMDGQTLAAGAVASVRNIANPVSLARAVMEKTDHVMLTDRGANMFAERIGTAVAHDLVTEPERKEWEHSKSYRAGVEKFFNTQWGHDTVGAVALDSFGNVACATSTGGIRNKMVGRVGDSPIIGSGGYADNRSGAVSCTGHGESILKVTLARLILFHMEQGKSATAAAAASLQYMSERVKGCGGAIVLSSMGDWAASFTTPRMAWASIKEDQLHYGLNPKEEFTEMLKL
ncbi:isoaspartyl peptidase/L-asparaginase isoform X1 [Pseudorasbora parva]|uniref:isoaspartyl peptidase/L-asparaginase isoform X1 n=2 Tax=Pseudorasbora parva TaxID=51549 RepID=UPI00351F0AB2